MLTLVHVWSHGQAVAYDTTEEYLSAMGVNIIKKKKVGESMTSVQKPTGAENQKMASTAEVETDGTLIHFEIGHTKNLGNYESIRFHVGVTLPAKVDTMDAAFDAAKEWADKKIEECVDEVDKELG